MMYQCYSSEEQLKLARAGWIGMLELEMFGVGMVGMAMFGIGNFGETLEILVEI
jgi:hypothetical protein